MSTHLSLLPSPNRSEAAQGSGDGQGKLERGGGGFVALANRACRGQRLHVGPGALLSMWVINRAAGAGSPLWRRLPAYWKEKRGH
jgi:hypothetical protein